MQTYSPRIHAFRAWIVKELPRAPNDKTSRASLEAMPTRRLIQALHHLAHASHTGAASPEHPASLSLPGVVEVLFPVQQGGDSTASLWLQRRALIRVIPAEQAGLPPGEREPESVINAARVLQAAMDYWVPARARPREAASLGRDDSRRCFRGKGQHSHAQQ